MSVEGLDRLNKTFQKLPEKAATGIVNALDKGGQEVADAARSLAPVDTRALQKSIGHVVRPLPDDKGAVAYVIADKFYGRFVEFGQRTTPAQPFFFPAYRLLRKRVKGRIKRAIKKAAKITNGG